MQIFLGGRTHERMFLVTKSWHDHLWNKALWPQGKIVNFLRRTHEQLKLVKENLLLRTGFMQSKTKS
jgi:hypothetical protein